MKKLSLFLLLTCLVSLTNATAQNKEIYTWTDDNGITHFGDAPVQGNDAEVINQDNNNNVASLAPKVNQWQQDYQKNRETKSPLELVLRSPFAKPSAASRKRSGRSSAVAMALEDDSLNEMIRSVRAREEILFRLPTSGDS